jgi:hypothetical protein
MEKINFQNNTSPYINDINLNQMQDNIENAIGDAIEEIKQEVLDAEMYSTSEIKTNKIWIDGKPIYRKVYNTTTVAGNNNISISNISSNIESIIKMDGFIIQSSGNITSLSYYYTSNDWCNLYYSANSDNIIIRCGTTASFGNTYLIVEYTKTND